MVGKKWEPIDIVSLYAKSSSDHWNKFLTKCYVQEDVKLLQEVLYGLQAGMNELVKKKIDTEDLRMFFIRLQRSIEQTAKKVFRKKYPSPYDDPVLSTQHKHQNNEDFKKHIDAKRKRDIAFNQWRKSVSY